MMDYKELDTQNIVRYLQLFSGGVNVDNILRYSGADKLRVYPAGRTGRTAHSTVDTDR